jgi:hypothetical protein
MRPKAKPETAQRSGFGGPYAVNINAGGVHRKHGDL